MILPRIQQTALRYPDKTAIQMKVGDHYQRYTYRELVVAVASASKGLAEHGIVKGDRVALLSENRLEWVFAYLSVVALGAVIVPMDAQLTDKEVAVLLASSGAKAICVSASCREKLPKDSDLLVISFDPGEGLSFPALLTAHPDADNAATACSGRSGRALVHLGHDRRSQRRHALPRQPCVERAHPDQARHPEDRGQRSLHPSPAPYLSVHGLHCAAAFPGHDRDVPEQPERAGHHAMHAGDRRERHARRSPVLCRTAPRHFRRDREKAFCRAQDRELPAYPQRAAPWIPEREHREKSVRQGAREVRSGIQVLYERRRPARSRGVHRHDQARLHHH